MSRRLLLLPAALSVALSAAALDNTGGAPQPAPAARAEAAPVPPATLDDAIERTLERPEFAWRMPREGGRNDEAPGFFGRMMDWLVAHLERAGKWLGRQLRRLFEWIIDHLRPSTRVRVPGDVLPAQVLWGAAAVLTALLLAVLLLRIRHLRRVRKTLDAQPVQAVPDVTREDVAADELPEDEWVALARGYAQREEWRLALRTLFLGCLAHLGRREIVRIARHKSNREYLRETRRRAHDRPPLLDAFNDNVAIIDRVWYGDHPAGRETVERFSANYGQIVAASRTAPATAATPAATAPAPAAPETNGATGS